ncbi:MAG TPA: hypothetical protein VF737_01045 [Gemmatimonadaceae bacterium]
MRMTEASTLQSLRSVQRFIDANQAALGGVPASGARAKLDAIVVSLDGCATAQSSSDIRARSATLEHYALRRALVRDHMAPIATIAASELSGAPEVEPLRLPQRRLSAEKLKAAAYGMAQAAAPFADVFTGSGMPPDFPKQLTDAADAMLATVTERRQRAVERKHATVGIRQFASQGRRVVHVLNALIRSALRDDPALLEAWHRAQRVYHVPGGAGAPTPS